MGPTKVMPIVAAKCCAGGGISDPVTISPKSVGLSLYVETFPQSPLFIVFLSQKHAPFFFGYILTMYAAGKYLATRILSGKVSTTN